MGFPLSVSGAVGVATQTQATPLVAFNSNPPVAFGFKVTPSKMPALDQFTTAAHLEPPPASQIVGALAFGTQAGRTALEALKGYVLNNEPLPEKSLALLSKVGVVRGKGGLLDTTGNLTQATREAVTTFFNTYA